MSVLLQDRVATSDEQIHPLVYVAATDVTHKPHTLIDVVWVMSIPVLIVSLMMGGASSLGWVNDIPAGSVSTYAYFIAAAVALVVFFILLASVGAPKRR